MNKINESDNLPHNAKVSEKSKIASLTWLAAGPGCVDSSSDDVSRSLGYP